MFLNILLFGKLRFPIWRSSCSIRRCAERAAPVSDFAFVAVSRSVFLSCLGPSFLPLPTSAYRIRSKRTSLLRRILREFDIAAPLLQQVQTVFSGTAQRAASVWRSHNHCVSSSKQRWLTVSSMWISCAKGKEPSAPHRLHPSQQRHCC